MTAETEPDDSATDIFIARQPIFDRHSAVAGYELVFRGGREKTLALSAHYRNLCDFLKVPLFDVGDVISTDGVDGIHFSEQNNLDLSVSLGTFIVSKVLPVTR